MAKYVIKKEWIIGSWMWCAYRKWWFITSPAMKECSCNSLEKCEEKLRAKLAKGAPEVVKELEI